MNDLDWYVIQSHPRKEGFVRDRIEEFEREAFLPVVRQRIGIGRPSRAQPLFPGYLFARLSGKGGDLARVRWLQGVRRLLGAGGQARPVDPAIVECIRSRSDRSGYVNLGARARRGTRVRIVDGPLAGLVGILERPAAAPNDRVCVLLEVFHRSTRVELPSRSILGAVGA